MASARWRAIRRPWLAIGVQVAALEVVVVGITSIAARHDASTPSLDLLGYVLLIIAAGAMVFSPRWTVGAFALALAATVAYEGFRYPGGPMVLGVMATLYKAATPGRPGRSAVLGGIAVAALLAVAAVVSGSPTENVGVVLLAMLALVVLPLTVGHAAANRRAYVAAVEDRARLAEQTREAEAQRRVAEERLRIARELHDIVSHSISVINIQAGVAAHLLAERPDQAQEALLAIKATSKEALRELRGILGVLRQVDEAESRAPAPGLAQVTLLVDTAIRAGLPTTLAIQGAAQSLPPAVDLAAYRIVQEGITNALRHAGPASAQVMVTYEQGRVVLEVADDGRGAAVLGEQSGRQGHGIAGMRERAAVVGGALEAGPQPGGGFRVRACLPVGRVQP